MGQPEVHADENDSAFLAGDGVRQSVSDLKRHGGWPRRACYPQAPASSLSLAEKLTVRPGTMVEMACL
jgi:hypothetical protein